MKCILAITAVLLLSACGEHVPTAPVPNESIADSEMARRAMVYIAAEECDKDGSILKWVSIRREPVVLAKRMNAEPDSNGKWTEVWAVKKGSARVTYSVTFAPAANGITAVSVGDGESAEKAAVSADDVLLTLKTWTKTDPPLSNREIEEDEPKLDKYPADAWIQISSEVALAFFDGSDVKRAKAWRATVQTMGIDERLEGAVFDGRSGICRWAALRVADADGNFIVGVSKSWRRLEHADNKSTKNESAAALSGGQ